MPPLPIPYCRVASHRRSTNHVTCSSVPFDTSGLCNSRLKTSVPLGRGAPRVGNNERRRATGRDLRSFIGLLYSWSLLYWQGSDWMDWAAG